MARTHERSGLSKARVRSRPLGRRAGRTGLACTMRVHSPYTNGPSLPGRRCGGAEICVPRVLDEYRQLNPSTGSAGADRQRRRSEKSTVSDAASRSM
jgi:hypothetical protein